MILCTTKQYRAVKNNIKILKISDNDLYQFGCEFEFYIDTAKYNLQDAVEQIKNRIKKFTNTDILVNLATLPTYADKNYCMQIKLG